MTLAELVISVFVHRNGLQDDVVHPLMTGQPRKRIHDWNTGFIRFPLSNTSVSQEFVIPWLNNDERLRFRWAPKWMQSSVSYTGRSGENLAFPQFTWPLDGELRTDRFDFFDGYMIWKYAGKVDE